MKRNLFFCLIFLFIQFICSCGGEASVPSTSIDTIEYAIKLREKQIDYKKESDNNNISVAKIISQQIEKLEKIIALKKLQGEKFTIESRIRNLDLEYKELEQKISVIKSDPPVKEPPVIPDPKTTYFNGVLTGDKVYLRSSASIEADKIADYYGRTIMLRRGSKVRIIEEYKPSNNYSEAVAKYKTRVFDVYGNPYNITIGQALIVVKNSDMDYRVSFIDGLSKKKIYADVEPGLLDFLWDDVWKKVIIEQGQSGWVLGRYIQSF